MKFVHVRYLTAVQIKHTSIRKSVAKATLFLLGTNLNFRSNITKPAKEIVAMAELFVKEGFLPETIEAAGIYCDTILSWALKRYEGSKVSSFKLSDCKQAFMTVNEVQLRAACCMLARDGNLRWVEKARILTFEVIENECKMNRRVAAAVDPVVLSKNNDTTQKLSTSHKRRDLKEIEDDDAENDKENQHRAKKPKNVKNTAPHSLTTAVTSEICQKNNHNNTHRNILGSILGESVLSNRENLQASQVSQEKAEAFNKKRKQLPGEFDLYEYEDAVMKQKDHYKNEKEMSDIKIHFETREEKKEREDLHASFDRSQDVYSKVLEFVSCYSDDEFELNSIIAKIQEKNGGFSSQEVIDAMKTMEKFNKIMFIDEQSLIRI